MRAGFQLSEQRDDADDAIVDRLGDYRRKRRFAATPEPHGDSARDARASRYVVQLHHARRRHFDLRLQVGGTLRSWAVPKGPSRDPSVRRLAIEVEDHPLAYGDFEGQIPRGEYGAGSVVIWDRGYWQPDGDAVRGLEHGSLGFTLYGERLLGHWRLLRTAPRRARLRQWLLVKSRDGWAQERDVADDRPLRSDAAQRDTTAALPDHDALQLAMPATAPPSGRHWLHELKHDGYRLLLQRDGERVRLRSRNGLDWTPKLPHLVAAMQRLPCRSAVLDAELVALDARGRSDFGRLQQALGSGTAAQFTVAFVFDLLHVDGRDWREQPLLRRKRRLAQLLGGDGPLRALEFIAGHGRSAYETACSQRLEGIVSKDGRAPYSAGRGDRWRKITCARSDEFAVVGYTLGKGSRKALGALLLASRETEGAWRYRGRVGSGFGEAELRALLARLKPVLTAPVSLDGSADSARRSERDIVWVRPDTVVEVRHRGLTRDGLLRQASYKGLRPDKSPTELEPMPTQRDDSRPALPTAPVQLTHPQRRVFERPPLTKADVAAYYTRIAAKLLPEIRRRPIALLRCPDGIGGDCFFQRHLTPGFGASVHEARLAGDDTRVIHVEDLRGLLSLVQMGTVEIHAAGFTLDRPGFPDRMVFDLDPGAGVSWARVIAAARTIRARLKDVGLRAFVRTTGGKGLHVVAPLRPVNDQDTVKAFAQALARTLAAEQPDEFVAVAGEARRRGRIFIDYLRNGRGAWAVASYSLRAREGAPVAAPLRWRELPRVGSAARFNATNIANRLSHLHTDPWDGCNDLQQTLPRSA